MIDALFATVSLLTLLYFVVMEVTD
ncbi:hypothetical protein PT2222_140013 [Paraburkholderia tropica]